MTIDKYPKNFLIELQRSYKVEKIPLKPSIYKGLKIVYY